jgi:hypothetical protein
VPEHGIELELQLVLDQDGQHRYGRLLAVLSGSFEA